MSFLRNASRSTRYGSSRISESNVVKVAVKQGVIVGRQEKLASGLPYASFLGIPYAQPPLGKLRFKSPVPLKHFATSELECFREGAISFQKNPVTQENIGSENCLFLNVYTPKTTHSKPLPVMVWIHGGGFLFGDGNSNFYFPERLLDQQVIVVTLNYRLGALGFLYLPAAQIHGNAGLKDQRLALEWIQENISNFNGDPNNVTLFGESAGGSSIHLHCYAKHAKQLFHKVIMQSGTGNMEWVFQDQPEQKTKIISELLGYQFDKQACAYKLLEFLQSEQVTPGAIVDNNTNILPPEERSRSLPFIFKPVVEEADSTDVFIDKPIMELLCDESRKPDMPIILGYNSAEGISMLLNIKRKIERCETDLARFVPRKLINDPKDPVICKIVKDLRDFYFKGECLSDKHQNGLADIYGDLNFIYDLQHVAHLHATQHSNNAPLYFYRFDYVGGRNRYKDLFQCGHLNGTCHGDELFYLFQMAGENDALSDQDLIISKTLAEMWANFAKYGNPSTQHCQWTPVKHYDGTDETDFQLNFLHIDRVWEMRNSPDAERMKFWRQLYRKYSQSNYRKIKSRL